MKYKSHIIFLLLIILLFVLIILGIYKCPFKFIFGISCPICGMYRAIYYFLQLDLKSAFYYHMMFPFVILGFVFYLIFRLNSIKINKRIVNFLLIFLGVLNLIYYFYRLFSGSLVVYFSFEESLIYKIIHFFIS